MRSVAGRILFAMCSLGCLFAQSYTADGKLTLPADYREWVFLSAGLGMTYQQAAGDRAPSFTNVFVNRDAYRSFITNGVWPDKTMLVLEIRGSESKGSINQGGSYQGGVLAIESEVKDTTKFPGNGWAFFGFGTSSQGKLLARSENCYTCHAEHGAVDNTFVQFYPTLLEIAKSNGTVKPAY